jgi:hypothetical protein
MTTVNSKNQCQQPANTGYGCNKPGSRPSDAEAFIVSLRQSLQDYTNTEDQRRDRDRRDGQKHGQGDGQQGRDDNRRGGCGDEQKQEENKCRPRAHTATPKSTPKTLKDVEDSFDEMVKRLLSEHSSDFQRNVGGRENTCCKPDTRHEKSVTELAQQFVEDFVEAIEGLDQPRKGPKPKPAPHENKRPSHKPPSHESPTHKPPASKAPTHKPSMPPAHKMPAHEAPAHKMSVSGNPGHGNAQSVPTETGIQSLDRWDSQFAAASRSTGLPANYLKAVAWAESRGNPGEFSHNPDGKHDDLGVMQISDYTYGDVMSNQSGAPRGLHAHNAADNIMMGAWELKDKFGRYGQNKSYAKTSAAYRGVGDGRDLSYGNAVVKFWEQINQGDKPSDNGSW